MPVRLWTTTVVVWYGGTITEKDDTSTHFYEQRFMLTLSYLLTEEVVCAHGDGASNESSDLDAFP